ncbi:MAG: tetratricopeptide repeat protein [Pyrinomonadaceae bacterium]
MNKRNEQAIKTAITCFEAAIAIDPDFALSYAFLADAYFALGTELVAALPPAEALAKGEAAALQAVELDDTLAEAHTALAVIRLYSWRWAEAEQGFKRALELNPNYGAAHLWYALYFASQGRIGEAIAMIGIAGRNTTSIGALGSIYARAGRKGDARRILDELLEMKKHRHVSFTCLQISTQI